MGGGVHRVFVDGAHELLLIPTTTTNYYCYYYDYYYSHRVVVDGAHELLRKIGREARRPLRVEGSDARSHLRT